MKKKQLEYYAEIGKRKKSISGFSKEYQGKMQGRFEQLELKRKRRARIIRAACLLVVVLIGFFITDVMLNISEAPAPDDGAITQQADNNVIVQKNASTGIKAIGAPIRMLDSVERTGRIIAQAKDSGANAVCFTFKDEDGYLCYPSTLPQQSILQASRKARTNVAACMNAYKEAGIKVVARVNCFCDPIAAHGMANGRVNQKNSTDYWLDSAGRGWLNPYSQAAKDYLLGVIGETAALGADYILLDSVSFPTGDLEQAVFAGETEATPAQRNAALLAFVKEAQTAAGNAKILCGMNAQGAVGAGEEYGGNLWKAECYGFAVDARNALWVENAVFKTTKPVVVISQNPTGKETFITISDEG